MELIDGDYNTFQMTMCIVAEREWKEGCSATACDVTGGTG